MPSNDNEIKEIDFKEFDKSVKKYYPLNKEKTRYLIQLNDGKLIFYKKYFDKKLGYSVFEKE
jgi:adenine-specific DNA methylase